MQRTVSCMPPKRKILAVSYKAPPLFESFMSRYLGNIREKRANGLKLGQFSWFSVTPNSKFSDSVECQFYSVIYYFFQIKYFITPGKTTSISFNFRIIQTGWGSEIFRKNSKENFRKIPKKSTENFRKIQK